MWHEKLKKFSGISFVLISILLPLLIFESYENLYLLNNFFFGVSILIYILIILILFLVDEIIDKSKQQTQERDNHREMWST